MKKEKIILIFFFAIVVPFVLGWRVVMGNSTGKNDTDTSITNPQNYYFEMDKNEQSEFFKKLNSVKIGDSVQKVKTILGEPTYERKVASKEGKFIAKELLYYIKILKKNLVNEKYDRSVRLLFNADDRLIKIESNVEDWRRKGDGF